ncbi:forkhead box protein O [Planococcus citri]|uniref:forkhead box protein O n=1 Tax=Planococcus citri TaxID=170843 RepID=UPI0031F753EA
MDIPLSEVDSSFEPLQRARSNTWPLPRPENFEETSMSPTVNPDLPENLPLDGKCSVIPELINTSPIGASSFHCNQLKKGSSRRNAWGNLSYADLITQAITSSPENRLTLSQIYEWMVHNVPYFKDKGDNNSSAGWKNSIRHNLSLHNRFMRVQNEGTGKSSWWMLNPDAKPGKSTRRRATSMETSKFEKRRGRVKKKVDALRNGLAETNVSPSSSISETVDLFPDSPLLGFQASPDFRTRASSNASSCSRLSPIPAVEPEWTMNFNNYLPTDQLAGNLEQSMKINSSDSFLYSTYQPQAQTPTPVQPTAAFSRIPFGQQVTTSSSQNCLLHQGQPCNCQLLSDIKQSLSPITRSSNSSPATQYLTGMDQSLNLLDDLNINIEALHTDFECNVDEVIRHELSIGGSLDFNFGAAITGQNPPTTQNTSSATASHGQPTFNGHSWVH